MRNFIRSASIGSNHAIIIMTKGKYIRDCPILVTECITVEAMVRAR